MIGAGSGGVRAARMAATYGAKVAVIEEDRVGGTCVIRGCVPKKLFVYASRFADMFEMAPSFGWTVDAELRLADAGRQQGQGNRPPRGGLCRGGREARRRRSSATAPSLTGPNSVTLVKAGRELTAKYILVATGGHPHVPDIPGKELGITSNEAFDLEAIAALDPDRGRRLYRGWSSRRCSPGSASPTTIVYRGDRRAARLRRGPAHRT